MTHRRQGSLLACAYSVRNAGDAALVHAAMSVMERAFPGEPVHVTSVTPQLDRDALPAAEVLPTPVRGDDRIGGLLHGRGERHLGGAAVSVLVQLRLVLFVVRWLAATRLRMPWVLSDEQRRLLAVLTTCRCVVAMPGGYLQAPLRGSAHWYYQASVLLAARLSGRRVVGAPASFGPFVAPHRRCARVVLGCFSSLLVRDAASVEVLRRLGVRESKISRVPDLAFSLRPQEHGLAVLPEVEQDLVLLSVRPFHYSQADDAGRAAKDYRDAIAAACRAVAAKGYRPTFVLQTSEDEQLTREVAREVEDLDVAVIDCAQRLPDLLATYARGRLLVATRLHAAILAAVVGAPAVAVAYEQKHYGAYEDLGLSDMVVSIYSPAGLPALVVRALERPHDREALKARTSLLGATSADLLLTRVLDAAGLSAAPVT